MKRSGQLSEFYFPNQGKISGANSNDSILEPYAEWHSFAIGNIPPPDQIISQLWDIKIETGQDSSADENLTQLLQKAESVLIESESSIPVSIDTSIFQIGSASSGLDYSIYEKYNGIFYTAMLNVGNTDRTLLFYSKNPTPFLGYSLKKGTIEAYAHCLDFLGYKAKGGCIANYGRNSWCFGTDALGGFFVNNGALMDYFGQWAQGGMFVNNGLIGGGFGYGANEGIFINYNQSANYESNHFGFGEYSKGGIFIDAKEISMQDYLIHYLGLENNRFMRYSSGIGINAFMMDNSLKQMVAEMKIYTNNNFNKIKFSNLANKIKDYCLEKYIKN